MSRIVYTCTSGGKETKGSVDSSNNVRDQVNAEEITSVYEDVMKKTNTDSSHDISCSRINREPARQKEDLEWIHRRMTPDCKQWGWNPSQVVSFDKWSCRYMGKGIIKDNEGNERNVYNPYKSWSGTIASCAALNAQDMAIPDSTYSAVQKMAYHQADGDASQLNLDDFVCRIESLPRM